ncbi:MAG: hypothetical protein FWG35_00195 [Spirochaetaceae bacterium]|nr:hypothetical protein [Spirochaetaceae bacterium]
MKKISRILPVLCLMLFAPAGAFALFDINLYGGIPFSGQYADSNQKMFSNNSAWGLSAHLNSKFYGVLQLGLGGFYQNSTATYKVGEYWWDGDFNVDRNMLGFEAYAQLDIPVLPFGLYVKANTAAWSKIKGDVSSHTDNFKRHGVGGGLLITLIPIPQLMRVQLFFEVDREFGKEDGQKVKQSNFFIGLRADF